MTTLLNLTGFRILGLHGRRDINITVRDSCLILVGLNGLGKTTIINFLYYFLSRQWIRLLEFEFSSIELDINNTTLAIRKDQIQHPLKDNRIRARLARLSPRLARNPALIEQLLSGPHDPSILRQVSDHLGMTSGALFELRHWLEDEVVQQELFARSDDVKQVEAELSKLVDAQVVYLPTYRRIERDLEKLFPGLEEKLHGHRSNRPRDRSYLEFVEFGMRDVEQRFAELFGSLKERARRELNELAATYLGEVIRGEADTYDMSLISSIDQMEMARILNRVEERKILDEPEKHTLQLTIARLRDTPKQDVSTRDKYVAHFFSKLASIHRSLDEAEASVARFVAVCNRYLFGKHVVFDDRKYAISIIADDIHEGIELQHLSSGEKQIISLFAHILLSGNNRLILIIDEPELSLSMPWQRILLPDIRSAGTCTFLAAATHSPFIYDNELGDYAEDLQQCVRTR